MSGKWKIVKVQDVAKRTATGPFGSAISAKYFVDIGIPVIRGSNLSQSVSTRLDDGDLVFVDEHKAEEFKRSEARRGDLVFTCWGTIDQVGLIDSRAKYDRYIVSNKQMLLTPDDNVADSLYLYYYFSSAETRSKIINEGIGSSVPGFNLGQLRSFEIPLPPLAEQKAIAAVLGALDDKIEVNRRMNATLEAMARALFQSWFVDFDPVRAKLDGRTPPGLDSATADLFPEHLEESPLGKKPVGWGITTLETTLSVLEVGGRPKGGVGGITNGIPSIGAESIVGVGQFDFGKTKYVPVAFYEDMKKGHIQSHDVLLYKDGGRPGEYEPHVSMFGDGFPFEKCSINEHVYRLRANDHLSQEYLYFWLTSELALGEMRMKGTGVAIPGLNSTAVRSLTTLLPPKPIVAAFTKQAVPLITRILANSKQSRTLATLRDTLLPKLLSGDLRPTQPAPQFT